MQDCCSPPTTDKSSFCTPPFPFRNPFLTLNDLRRLFLEELALLKIVSSHWNAPENSRPPEAINASANTPLSLASKCRSVLEPGLLAEALPEP